MKYKNQALLFMIILTFLLGLRYTVLYKSDSSKDILINIVNNINAAITPVITTSVKKFGAKGNGVTDDTRAIQSALNSDNTTIYFPAGTYKITGQIIVNAGTVKKILGTKGTILSISLPSSINLFHFYRDIGLKTFVFNFNNGPVSSALNYGEGLGVITLKDLHFINVRDTDTTTSSTIINIATRGNTVNIDTIEFKNIYKTGNGIIGDSGGNVTGIYLGDRANVAPINGTIRNVRVIEMHNIGVDGDIVFEDTSGIYLYSAYTGKDGFLSINNVYGYNFGKRLIKLDASHIYINKVYAFSNTNDSLSAIGMNNTSGTKQNNTVVNAKIYGTIHEAIAIDANNVIINNVIIDIKKTIMKGIGPNAIGIGITSNQISISNANIIAERCILFNNNSNIVQDIKIINAKLTVPSWGCYVIQFNTAYGFKNLTIQNVAGVNNSTSSNSNSFLDTSLLTGTAKQKGNGLNIINCTMYGASINNYGMILKNIDNINITNLIYSNNMVIKAYSGAFFDICKNIKITNFACKAYTRVALQFSHCDNISVIGLNSSVCDYPITATSTKFLKSKNIGRGKIILN